MTIVLFNYFLGIGSIAMALRLGGSAERFGALTLSIMLLISIFGIVLFDQQFVTVDPVSLTQDAVGLLGFSLIGVYSKRIWPLWAAALQLLSVGSHFVRALELPVRPIVYAWMKSGPTWGVLAILILATLAHRHREARLVNAYS